MGLDDYIKEVNKKLPDIKERLNGGCEDATLAELEQLVGAKLPSEFIALYKRFDGEVNSIITGFIGGFDFLPLEKVIEETKFFKSLTDDKLEIVGTEAIMQSKVKVQNWIPFAFDSSRAYLAIDLSPSEKGKWGQVVTADWDYNECHLFADSLEQLFDKMTIWMDKGILVINTEDDELPFIGEVSGHLFNNLDKLIAED